MPVSIVTPPADYPVTLVEAKAHCRVDGADDDDQIDGLIAAATAHVEAYTGRSILTQTLLAKFDAFADEIILPRGPVQSITSVTYYDVNGNSQVAASSLYTLSGDSIFRKPSASWPAASDGKDIVAVTYVTGKAACPAPIRQAILLLVGWWFSQREAANVGNIVTEVPHAVAALLANFRNYGF